MSGTTCGEYRELASAFADEQLEGAELLRLEAHLERCPECREFEGGLRRFRELLRAAEAFRPLRRPPPAFAATVAARAALSTGAAMVPLRERPAPRRFAGGPWIGMAAAAALAALFFAWSWQRLFPGDLVELPSTARPAASLPVASAGSDEGDIDTWMREHAMLARANTLLGPAEEIELAGYHAGPFPDR